MVLLCFVLLVQSRLTVISKIGEHMVRYTDCSICLAKWKVVGMFLIRLQSTPVNLEIQGKLKKVGVIGSSSYEYNCK